MLQHPISNQCESTGLKACDELTRGALLYADGEPAEGQASLKKGLVANIDKAPELKQFAEALKMIGRVPGAGQYVAPLQPAIALIDEAASKAALAPRTPPAIPQPEGRPGAIVRALDSTRDESQPTPPANPYLPTAGKQAADPLVAGPTNEVTEGAPIPPSEKFSVSGFILPTSDFSAHNAYSCDLADDLKAICVTRRAPADYVVTDLLVSTTCSREMVVLTGPISQPSWLVWVPAGRGLSEHGMRLPLHKGDSLIVGVLDSQKVRSPIPDSTKPRTPVGSEWRCGVTWAAAVNKK